MGIMLLFLAPGAVEGCGPVPQLDVDLGSPSGPPPFSMPLPRAPKGPVSTKTSTSVRDFTYGAERILLRRGTTFTWRFQGALQHDVTVIGGPVGFSAPWTTNGVFTHRFTKAGVYRLFCSLHPARMVQQITVR
jgi:plastocyanin